MQGSHCPVHRFCSWSLTQCEPQTKSESSDIINYLNASIQHHLSGRITVTATRLQMLNRTKELTENDGHAIGVQDIYRLKIDYITMQCAILFKTTAEYKS